ncbi:nuclear factor of activated T-cells, cytoplasmic 4-like [Hemiscyllium ocellatum]|uniref:nuclear factor of activated T-cells, cytoplasmic 4-like n=1 Tax=Hemiscyllium ocellatum TaxID=170820 RepID=UPI002965DA8C|nr:nuclear factor of activated T-cells, cytoplasmic 4-like [Hemiscyllium ocellatum]
MSRKVPIGSISEFRTESELTQRSAQELPSVDGARPLWCPVTGGGDLLVTGSNFLPESRLLFTEKAPDGQTVWEVQAKVDRTRSTESLLVAEIPPYLQQTLQAPVQVCFLVCNGKRKRSTCQTFRYLPVHVKTEDASEELGPAAQSPCCPGAGCPSPPGGGGLLLGAGEHGPVPRARQEVGPPGFLPRPPGSGPEPEAYRRLSGAYGVHSEGYSPRPEAYRNRGEGDSLRPVAYDIRSEGYSPRPEAYDICSEGYSPRPEAYRNRCEGYSPRPEAYDIRSEGYSPRPEAYGNCAEGYSPRSEAYRNHAEGYSPRPEAYGNRSEGYSPRPEAYDPDAKAHSNRAEGYRPACMLEAQERPLPALGRPSDPALQPGNRPDSSHHPRAPHSGSSPCPSQGVGRRRAELGPGRPDAGRGGEEQEGETGTEEEEEVEQEIHDCEIPFRTISIHGITLDDVTEIIHRDLGDVQREPDPDSDLETP